MKKVYIFKYIMMLRGSLDSNIHHIYIFIICLGILATFEIF